MAQTHSQLLRRKDDDSSDMADLVNPELTKALARVDKSAAKVDASISGELTVSNLAEQQASF